MKDDEELDQLLSETAKSWRQGVDVPRDEIWQGVRGHANNPASMRRGPGWRVLWGAAAASLLFGVALGRTSAHVALPAAGAIVSMGDSSSIVLTAADESYADATRQLLGRTALLLAALPDARLPSSSTSRLAEQGGELLTTTRVLLNSPSSAEPRMRALLQDLELVLAQVARLRSPADADLGLIHDALDAQEIVPRLRSAVIGEATDLN